MSYRYFCKVSFLTCKSKTDKTSNRSKMIKTSKMNMTSKTLIVK
jgi:hypothetical protein